MLDSFGETQMGSETWICFCFAVAVLFSNPVVYTVLCACVCLDKNHTVVLLVNFVT